MTKQCHKFPNTLVKYNFPQANLMVLSFSQYLSVLINQKVKMNMTTNNKADNIRDFQRRNFPPGENYTGQDL